MAGVIHVLNAERDRWILWIPVAFATGIGVYFVACEQLITL